MFLPDPSRTDPVEISAKVVRIKELRDGNFEIGLEFMHIEEIHLQQIMKHARYPSKDSK